MARIAEVFVIARGTGEAEHVMPPAGVLHDLHQRLMVRRPVFREDTGLGIAVAHQGSRGGRLNLPLQPFFEGAEGERLKVGTFPPLYVEDLNPLTRLHLIGGGVSGLDVEVLKRIGQRIRRGHPALALTGIGAADVEDDFGRRVLRFGQHRAADGADDQEAVRLRVECRHVAGDGGAVEHLHGISAGEVETGFRQCIGDAATGSVAPA